MLKVKIFSSKNPAEFEKAVNEFISDESVVRNIVSIQYQPMWIPSMYTGPRISEIYVYDRVLITYEDYVTLDDI